MVLNATLKAVSFKALAVKTGCKNWMYVFTGFSSDLSVLSIFPIHLFVYYKQRVLVLKYNLVLFSHISDLIS